MGVLDKVKPAPAAAAMSLTIEGVVFDLDGTLLDTEALYRDAFADAAATLGLDIPRSVYAGLVGIATCERGAILRKRYGREFPWEALKAAYYVAREERLAGGLRVKPGAPSLLRHIERMNLGKAIATSASRHTAEAHLQAVGLGDCFDIVVTRDDVARGKPYPDVFALAAQEMGIPPRRCLALEDSEPGISAAWLAGMLPLMVVDTLAATDAVRAHSVGVVPDLNHVRALLGG